MSPRTSSGQASSPYETVPNGTISSPSEGGRKPRGELKTLKHALSSINFSMNEEVSRSLKTKRKKYHSHVAIYVHLCISLRPYKPHG